jgi:drug/metabolite transporter (DMT)-like permease
MLALGSAFVYGVADWCGGRGTRTSTTFAVTLVGQAMSLLLLLAIVPLLGEPIAARNDWLWGAAGGAFGVLGILAFYHALANGAMTVVAPITAVVSVVIPVSVGLLEGERPGGLALVGIVVAALAIALVSGAGRSGPRSTSPKMIALAVFGGVGFGFIFVCLDRASDDSGLWPLVGARLVSVPVVVLVAFLAGGSFRMQRPAHLLAIGSGALDMSANVLYLLSTREGLLTVVSVITSLYPVSTVMLAFAVDRERVSRSQGAGMVLAGAAIGLVALGRS